MISLSLLSLVVSYYGSDTVIVYNSGFNNVLRQGLWGSTYFERVLSSELIFDMREQHSMNWDSLSKEVYRISSNTFEMNYLPAEWLELIAGVAGSRITSTKNAGVQGYTRNTANGFFESTISTDIFYADYYFKYADEKTAASGPELGWSCDRIKEDALYLKTMMKPCTLAFYHQREERLNRFDGFDSVTLSLSKIPFLTGWFRSSLDIGRQRSSGFTDDEKMGAMLWARDTFSLTPRIGLNFDAYYRLDTLTNYRWASSTYQESEGSVSARLGYQPFRYTNLKLDFAAVENSFDQADDEYDENISEYSFTGSVSQNFNRRPDQAKWLASLITLLAPGSMSFSHGYSLSKIRTPNSPLNRDVYNERLYFSTSLRPGEALSTNFKLTHQVQLTHYLNSEYAASSSERKTSSANWDIYLDLDEYLNASNSAKLSYDWNMYYNDSTRNRADRTWRDDFVLILFPDATLEPRVSFDWTRYESWRILAGAFSRTDLKDIVEQRYSLSYRARRREEAPSWWSTKWWEKDWLKITGFWGTKWELIPSGPQRLMVKAPYTGMETEIKPWPYVQLSGGFKLRRSEYEAPFEVYLSIYSSF